MILVSPQEPAESQIDFIDTKDKIIINKFRYWWGVSIPLLNYILDINDET